MQDLRQSPNHAKFMRSMGWVVETKNGVNYFIRRIPFIGSFIKIQRPKKTDLKYVEELRKKYKAFQTIIEPGLTPNNSAISSAKDNRSLLYTHGFKSSKSPFLPTKTIHINLTKTQNMLLKEMHSKTRYNIGKSQKLKVKIKKSNDIELFIKLYHKWHRKRMWPFSQAKQIRAFYRAYGKDAQIFFAYSISQVAEWTPGTVKNKIVAGLLLLSFDKVTYYMYAASSSEGKKLFAPTFLTWGGIRLAKKRGSAIFDFEGIYDERFPLKSWLGFTRFKKSFGGYEVKYPGAFTKIQIPFI